MLVVHALTAGAAATLRSGVEGPTSRSGGEAVAKKRQTCTRCLDELQKTECRISTLKSGRGQGVSIFRCSSHFAFASRVYLPVAIATKLATRVMTERELFVQPSAARPQEHR